MNKEISPGYVFKYAALAESLYNSLSDDPFYIALLKPLAGEAAKKTALLKYLDYSMQEATQYGRLFIPDGDPNGVSIWARPMDESAETAKKLAKKSFIRQNIGKHSLHIYDLINAFMADKVQQSIPDDAWYLSILGVNPARQGQGLGSALVRGVLQDTDRLMKPTYLETFNPKSLPFYQRLGYEIIAKVDEPNTNASYWVLMRKPVSSLLA
ncbi:acetyltransferase (GNAT) family protein [Mucilaginibacter gracilis]|uniref:Acetyltransferase (GNAT) family protein n=1 Tax=Mucilaginibacter gracilis TaxID=423350 RepID=A0A495IZQ9_9SPHI|nr:GNAT family N-acetyltransferase [Mucilaginibacter gracilis]RKR82003.1 acetyltransferase (GNAT) family protein [Mucilaginibacter gracilis]